MENFTPLSALAGGVLIGTGAAAMLLFGGKIAGISGIVSAFINPSRGDFLWRVLFVAGLLVGGAILSVVYPGFAGNLEADVDALVILGGLLVGFGTRLGNGCTSGHGVCGVSRLSPRSLAATGTFILTGILTVFVVRTVAGGI